MVPLFETILEQVPAPEVDRTGPLQMQISSLDYSSYVGVIGIARIKRGTVKPNSPIRLIDNEGKERNGRIMQVLGFHGLDRIEVESAQAGDIVAITGIENLHISDTLCDPALVEALPPLTVDEPTISMMFQPNSSPFAGKEGKYVTSRNIWDRLQQELLHNVALRVERTEQSETFRVSGRGELHLSVLIENMRREGYEVSVGRPVVITRSVDGKMEEPFERVTIDIEEQHQGSIMDKMGERRAALKDMVPDGKGRVRLDYIAPARGMIGFRTEFLTATSGFRLDL